MPLRHVPQRTCVGCRTEHPKRAFVRIVRGAAGGVSVDPTGKAPGRGAYLCPEPECWTRALQRGALAHALRTTVSDADRAALAAYRDALVSAAGVE